MADAHIHRAMIILDFGGQYAHLIASRIRRFGFKSFILPADTKPSLLKSAAGVILSGGPQSVYEKGSPQADPGILDQGIPVLGLCYGHHWLGHAGGGKVTPGNVKEYGPMDVHITDPKNPLFHGLPRDFRVWMSHGDEVSALPPGFVSTASTKNCANAAMSDMKRRLFGIQFHIEVTHTEHGMEILRRFVDLCGPEAWSVSSYTEAVSEQLQKEAGERPHSAPEGASRGKKVFMLVSGGVDSTVAFTLLNKVFGPKRVQGLLIDTGLMRKGEIKAIQEAFDKLGIKNLQMEDASKEFFDHLKDVYDPEEKRKRIGTIFLEVQKRVFDEMGLTLQANDWLLGQGTIYPDTIETGGTKHADKIKTHHNRVPLIQQMIEEGLVTEPLKELYKDEVRELGEELGLPHDLVWRHPFPGPGLGVRILCAKAAEPMPDSEKLRMENGKWKMNAVVLPIRSVGVQGDGRTYRHALVLFSQDRLPEELHYDLAVSIPNASRDINRVLICLSHADPFQPVFIPTTISRETADLLREADDIVDQEIRVAKLYSKIWQFPVVLLPVGTDKGRSVVLRPIESTDAMTAAAYRLPEDVLQKITERLMKLPGVDAVFLDLTNKPPGTIEWE